MQRTLFGNISILAFLLCQALDGVLTYLGVVQIGLHMEANPILGWLMLTVGIGPSLVGAKLVAGGLGIMLHLNELHKAVAILAALYAAVAVFPWIGILYYFPY